MTKTDNSLDVVAKHLPDAPIPNMVGVGAVALQMALQYWNINTVQDGVLYQQYKMEGKNLGGLHLDQVFETAIRMEQHLMRTNERVADIVIQTLETVIDNETSVKKLIYDFINEDVPSHPEPQVFSEHYKNLDISDTTEKGFKALELSLGLEDHELTFYNGIISEMPNEDRVKLCDKMKFCRRFDEFQTIIDNVINKVKEELPCADSVYALFKAGTDDATVLHSDPEAKVFLFNSFLEVAGILSEERPVFDKALSYFDVEQFYNNLKGIYLDGNEKGDNKKIIKTMGEIIDDVFSNSWEDLPSSKSLFEIHNAKGRDLNFSHKNHQDFVDTFAEASGIPPEEQEKFKSRILSKIQFARLVHSRMMVDY